MRKRINFLNRFIAILLFPSLIAGCSVDDKYDLSKDVDVTIGVGQGLSLPIGSLDKIMFTEIIDTLDSDVISIDSGGYYSVSKDGVFDPGTFIVNDVDIELSPASEKRHYDFELLELSSDYDNLPDWVKEKMKESLYPYVVHEEIDNITNFNINQSVPEEMKKLRGMTLRKPVKMLLELEIYSEDHSSDELLETTGKLDFKSDDSEGFIIEVPKYIKFSSKDNVKDGKLYINGSAVYDKTKKALVYSEEFTIVGLDFSALEEGFLAVNNATIELSDELHAHGYVQSDTVLFAYKDITHIQSVDVVPNLSIEIMGIETVEGVFDPVIDPISEKVDLALGEDLDFLNNAYFDFNDPKIFVSLENPIDGNILTEAEFVGYDDYDNIIDGSKVTTDFVLAAGTMNNLFFNRYDNQISGYSTVQIPDLNYLVKKIPEKIGVDISAALKQEFITVPLGKEFSITGNYSVSVPMVFDNFSLEYVETIDDVLGDDSEEITDYVNDVNSVTVTFDVFNTSPATFVPSVVAYTGDGVRLDNIKVRVDGDIAAGNGISEGVLSEPVKSSITVKLSSKNGELKYLNKLDLKFAGSGSGTFNSNEYIQVKDIIVTIDEQISVDLN